MLVRNFHNFSARFCKPLQSGSILPCPTPTNNHMWHSYRSPLPVLYRYSQLCREDKRKKKEGKQIYNTATPFFSLMKKVLKVKFYKNRQTFASKSTGDKSCKSPCRELLWDVTFAICQFGDVQPSQMAQLGHQNQAGEAEAVL